jgi:hypothetical protein
MQPIRGNNLEEAAVVLVAVMEEGTKQKHYLLSILHCDVPILFIFSSNVYVFVYVHIYESMQRIWRRTRRWERRKRYKRRWRWRRGERWWTTTTRKRRRRRMKVAVLKERLRGVQWARTLYATVFSRAFNRDRPRQGRL